MTTGEPSDSEAEGCYGQTCRRHNRAGRSVDKRHGKVSGRRSVYPRLRRRHAPGLAEVTLRLQLRRLVAQVIECDAVVLIHRNLTPRPPSRSGKGAGGLGAFFTSTALSAMPPCW